jgi:hypothetical protein
MSLAATKRLQITPQSFKLLSPETIKARTTNRTGGASICRNEDTLSHCTTSGEGINLKPAIAALRGDEPRMNL